MTQHWKLVPAEPTPEMWAAVNKLDDEMAAGAYDGKGASIEQIYNCMVDAAPTQTAQHYQWPTTVAQMKLLAAELIRAAESMGGDDEESQDIELVLAVAPAGTVQDDDGVWNGEPILTVRLEEYPEEGVYPVDPCDPTGGRIDTPPASAQPESQREGYPHDDPKFVALCREHDILGTAMQGLAAVFWRGASAQDDAKDERQAFEAWAKERGYQSDEMARCKLGIVSQEYFNLNTENAWKAWQGGRASVAAPASGDARDGLILAQKIDAAIDAAIAASQQQEG